VKVLLVLSSQDSLLVFRKTGRIAVKGKELVDLVVVQIHDVNNCLELLI